MWGAPGIKQYLSFIAETNFEEPSYKSNKDLWAVQEQVQTNSASKHRNCVNFGDKVQEDDKQAMSDVQSQMLKLHQLLGHLSF